jgi:hypothetical protein
MSEESQFVIPASFVALFVEAGRIKPNAAREHILERYEFCEDMATMLVDHARTKLWQLGVAETDILVRIHQGLLVPEAACMTAPEAEWVTRRLAELLEWECSLFEDGDRYHRGP